MKILILITKGEVGGAQMSVLNLARSLKERGKDVVVGFGNGNFLKQKLEINNTPYVQFTSLRRTHNPLASLFFILELRRYLKKNQFSTIHFNSSNTLAGALAAKSLPKKPKTIFTLRGLSLLDENYRVHPLLKWAYRIYFGFFLKYIDQNVFVSQTNADYSMQKLKIKNSTVIHNGLDPARQRSMGRDDARRSLAQILNIDFGGKYLIGSIGRLCYAKNYEFLISEFPRLQKQLAGLAVMVIGDGENRKRYQELMKKHQVDKNFILAGKIEDARKFIKAFDLFVLPSRYEGLSITLIEALFAGIPILATKVGGNAELLGESREQLYGLDGTAEFESKLLALAGDKMLAERLGRENRQRSNIFHLSATVDKYLQIYE